MLILKQEDYNKIVDHAKKGLPNEACGLLGGYVEGDKRVVTDVYLLRNVDESREHFSMDPAEQLAAIKDIRQKKGVLLGNFHSHPESPSRPSQEDIRLAYDSKMNYLILSLMNPEELVLNSFHIEKGEVTKEELVIEAYNFKNKIIDEKKCKRRKKFFYIFLISFNGNSSSLNNKICCSRSFQIISEDPLKYRYLHGSE